MNFIGREELKAALIYALNHGHADRVLDSIIRCIESYELPGPELRVTTFFLKIDAKRMLRSYEDERQGREQQRRENALAAIEYARQQRCAALVHSGRAAA